ncbi:hypothetical protein RYX36_005622 [Vicia faba]
MNTFMWNNPFTEKHRKSIDELGISLIPPVTKRRYNPHHVKAFYFCIKKTSFGIESQFHGKLIKFHFEDFKTHFGLEDRVVNTCLLLIIPNRTRRRSVHMRLRGFLTGQLRHIIPKNIILMYNTTRLNVVKQKIRITIVHLYSCHLF